MSPAFRKRLALFFTLSLFVFTAPFRSGAVPQSPAAATCVDARAVAPASSGPRGILNFGFVTPNLLRGGQPSTDGYHELREMGVEIVVSFRHEKGENSLERRTVESLGMRFVSFPWHAWDVPADSDVQRFFALLAANPRAKLFLHCQQGRDRTGAMVALYRIAVDRWCPQSAVAEMKAYHYHHFFFPQLETYVEKFPERLAKDQGLAAAVAPAAPANP